MTNAGGNPMTDVEAHFTPEEAIAAAIDAAEEILDPEFEKPRLLVENHSPDRTVADLRDVLAAAGELYDRGLLSALYSIRRKKGWWRG